MLPLFLPCFSSAHHHQSHYTKSHYAQCLTPRSHSIILPCILLGNQQASAARYNLFST